MSSIEEFVLMRTKLLKWSSFSPNFTRKVSFSPISPYIMYHFSEKVSFCYWKVFDLKSSKQDSIYASTGYRRHVCDHAVLGERGKRSNEQGAANIRESGTLTAPRGGLHHRHQPHRHFGLRCRRADSDARPPVLLCLRRHRPGVGLSSLGHLVHSLAGS